MKKMKAMNAALLILIILSLASTAFAGTYTTQASAVFLSSAVICSSTMNTEFKASTKADCSSIKVTSAVLQKKSGSSWVNDKTLTPPSKIVVNDCDYIAVSNYSDKVGIGTYRIKAVYSADGSTVTAYSNERTFN